MTIMFERRTQRRRVQCAKVSVGWKITTYTRDILIRNLFQYRSSSYSADLARGMRGRLLVKVERIIITDYGEIFPITETFRVTKTKGYSSFIEQNDWIGSGDLASSFVTVFPLPRNVGAKGRDVPSILWTDGHPSKLFSPANWRQNCQP